MDSVEPTADGRWLVAVTGPDGPRQREYDNVMVANGHHWDARLPDPAYPGSFDGEQIHSHAYSSTAQLVGRDVVVVGAGNSAMDIAVEAAKVARSAVISQRRGQWVLPKYALGRPADQVTLPSRLPFWFTAARMAFGARVAGNVARLGLPQPEHQPWQSHPVQSEGIRDALRSGTLTPEARDRPARRRQGRLHGRHVRAVRPPHLGHRLQRDVPVPRPRPGLGEGQRPAAVEAHGAPRPARPVLHRPAAAARER